VVVPGSCQNVIKHTPAPAGRERERGGGREAREGGDGGRRAPLPPKCYKTHTCNSGQRGREGEGGR